MNLTKTTESYKFSDDADLERLSRIIIKQGGNPWGKNEKKRVYFNDDHVALLPLDLVSPESAYIDMIQRELCIVVCKEDFENQEKPMSVYKDAFLALLRNLIKNNRKKNGC